MSVIISFDFCQTFAFLRLFLNQLALVWHTNVGCCGILLLLCIIDPSYLSLLCGLVFKN